MLASALRDVKDRMRQLFAQERTASNAGLLGALFAEELDRRSVAPEGDLCSNERSLRDEAANWRL
jgi:hypothetical protein